MSTQTDLYLILHDIRSAHNVGSLLRTADGLGVKHVYFTGYTPYPIGQPDDARLPHVAQKNHDAIHKTALGAEKSVQWSQHHSVIYLLDELQKTGIQIIGLEQGSSAYPLHKTRLTDNSIALIAGNEIAGVAPDIQKQCSKLVEIPMCGQKESFNVSVAVAMALHWFRYQQ